MFIASDWDFKSNWKNIYIYGSSPDSLQKMSQLIDITTDSCFDIIINHLSKKRNLLHNHWKTILKLVKQQGRMFYWR